MGGLNLLFLISHLLSILKKEVVFILVSCVFLNCHGNQFHVTFDSCMPCQQRTLNITSDNLPNVGNYVVNSIIELTSINTRELCRFYNDINEGDVSSIEMFRRDDIPVRPRYNHVRTGGTGVDQLIILKNLRDLANVQNKLATIAMFYKLGNTRTDNTEGLTLPDIENRIQSLLCALEAATGRDNMNSRPSCFRSFKVQSRYLFNRAEFGKWVFAILRQSRIDLCHIFNSLATSTIAATLRCDQLPTFPEVCLR